MDNRIDDSRNFDANDDRLRDDRLRDDVVVDEVRDQQLAGDDVYQRTNLLGGDRGDMVLRAERLVGDIERHEWAKVRLTRRIVTEERTITVPVRREELVVEYLGDEPAPKAHPNTVKGSTEAVDSRVVEEYVLHEEVPRVELDVVARERVQVVVDTQRSLVELSDTVRREQVDIHGDDHLVTETRRDDDRRDIR